MTTARCVLLVVLAAVSGCFVPTEVGERMQRDIEKLQRDLQRAEKGLDQQSAALDEKVAEASTQIRQVDQALQDLNRAARMTDADFGVQIERLIRETQELRGMIELAEYRLGQLETKLEGEGSITERVSTLESGGSGFSAKGTKSDNPSVIATNVPNEPKKMLVYADELIKNKKLDEARGVLRQVVRKAPKTQGVTDAAYYKLGKIYYDEKKYRNALQELVKVVEGFERGTFADDAYYRIGLASMDLGNLEDAQIFFNQVVKSYPKSTLVKAARKKLKEVDAKLRAERKR